MDSDEVTELHCARIKAEWQGAILYECEECKFTALGDISMPSEMVTVHKGKIGVAHYFEGKPLKEIKPEPEPVSMVKVNDPTLLPFNEWMEKVDLFRER